jgi:hypothetical protein
MEGWFLKDSQGLRSADDFLICKILDEFGLFTCWGYSFLVNNYNFSA